FMKPSSCFELKLIGIEVMVVNCFDGHLLRCRGAPVRQIISRSDIGVGSWRTNGERHASDVVVRFQPGSQVVKDVLVVCRQGYINDRFTVKTQGLVNEVIHLIGDYECPDDHYLGNKELKYDKQSSYEGSRTLRGDLVFQDGHRIKTGENHRRIKPRKERC